MQWEMESEAGGKGRWSQGRGAGVPAPGVEGVAQDLVLLGWGEEARRGYQGILTKRTRYRMSWSFKGVGGPRGVKRT